MDSQLTYYVYACIFPDTMKRIFLLNPFFTILFLGLIIGVIETSQAGTLSHIDYELHNISKKWIKDGDIIRQSVEPEHYKYRISRLDTKSPILGKYSNGKLIVEKPLTVLSVTSQGSIYLADVSQAGNIFLISIFPKQKTVAISWQLWLSALDVIVLRQGFGIYE